MINKNERQWLKQAIKKDLIPVFKQLGFEEYPLPEQFKGDRTMKIAYPFGTLRRYKKNTVDIIEVSLLEPGQVGFGISFGVVPATGYEHPSAGNISVENIYIVYLQYYYAAFLCPLINKEFSLWRWPGREVQQIDYQELVRKVIDKILPEIENVFKTGKVGIHIRKYGTKGIWNLRC